MIEIYKNIFVGNELDYEQTVKYRDGWAVVHACKEPYHRQALGYTGRAASKTHPEYLVARRGDRLILNLVDVDNPDWINPVIIDAAIEFIDNALKKGEYVLVHCNQGMSRSAGIGFLTYFIWGFSITWIFKRLRENILSYIHLTILPEVCGSL